MARVRAVLISSREKEERKGGRWREGGEVEGKTVALLPSQPKEGPGVTQPWQESSEQSGWVSGSISNVQVTHSHI